MIFFFKFYNDLGLGRILRSFNNRFIIDVFGRVVRRYGIIVLRSTAFIIIYMGKVSFFLSLVFFVGFVG